MARAVSFLVRQLEAFAVGTLPSEGSLAVHNVARPGRQRWIWEAISGMSLGWRNLREVRHLKIRWGWALLIAVALVLLMGELGPAASALIRLP